MQIVILFSGGFGSVAMLRQAMTLNHKPILLHVNYGQISSEQEIAVLHHYHNTLGVTIEEVFCTIPWYTGGVVNEKVQPVKRNRHLRETTLGSNYVPFRNGLLLSYAYSLCDNSSERISEIWMGIKNSITPYPDSDLHRLQRFTDISRDISFHTSKVVFPLEGYNHFDVYEELRNDINYSKYRFCQKSEPIPCGKCDGCLTFEDVVNAK